MAKITLSELAIAKLRYLSVLWQNYVTRACYCQIHIIILASITLPELAMTKTMLPELAMTKTMLPELVSYSLSRYLRLWPASSELIIFTAKITFSLVLWPKERDLRLSWPTERSLSFLLLIKSRLQALLWPASHFLTFE